MGRELTFVVWRPPAFRGTYNNFPGRLPPPRCCPTPRASHNRRSLAAPRKPRVPPSLLAAVRKYSDGGPMYRSDSRIRRWFPLFPHFIYNPPPSFEPLSAPIF